MSYPTTRHASPQAWRRLRKTMSDGELKNIAADIVAFIESADDGRIFRHVEMLDSVEFALTTYAWENQKQA